MERWTKTAVGPLLTISAGERWVVGEGRGGAGRTRPIGPVGPDRIDQRKALDGIIIRMCSGIRWNELPKEVGDAASVHRTFQRWVARRVIDRLGDANRGVRGTGRRVGLANRRLCTRQGPAPGDQVGPNPTDRTKRGRKRGVLTEGDGGPVAVVVTAADVHDSPLLQEAMKQVIVELPDSREHAQHLCFDKAFSVPPRTRPPGRRRTTRPS